MANIHHPRGNDDDDIERVGFFAKKPEIDREIQRTRDINALSVPGIS